MSLSSWFKCGETHTVPFLLPPPTLFTATLPSGPTPTPSLPLRDPYRLVVFSRNIEKLVGGAIGYPAAATFFRKLMVCSLSLHTLPSFIFPLSLFPHLLLPLLLTGFPTVLMYLPSVAYTHLSTHPPEPLSCHVILNSTVTLLLETERLCTHTGRVRRKRKVVGHPVGDAGAFGCPHIPPGAP